MDLKEMLHIRPSMASAPLLTSVWFSPCFSSGMPAEVWRQPAGDGQLSHGELQGAGGVSASI